MAVVGQGRCDGHGGTPEAGGRKICSLFVLMKSSRIHPPDPIFSGKPAGGIVGATCCLWMSGKRTRAEGEAVATIRR
jgi:hypothetical protein